MNKQEAIELVKNTSYSVPIDSSMRYIREETAIKIINCIDEPEKPVVSQFIADWYEEHKEDLEYNLYRLCINFHERKLYGDLYEWFKFDKNKPIETLILMHKFGYEVEKKKLYTVELPNPHGLGHTVLVKDMYENTYITYTTDSNWREGKVNHLTESEIKKDFPWAWQFAKEVKEND